MAGAYETLKKPLLTEKSLIERDTHNRYGFIVAKNASKGEIKTAVEKIFNVTVKKINTISVTGKTHRMGRFEGKRPDYKKAFVTLKEGDKIALVGFGTFSVEERAARTGINPATREKIEIAAKKVAKFKAGAELSEAIK
jgi:ribosomal protein L23